MHSVRAEKETAGDWVVLAKEIRTKRIRSARGTYIALLLSCSATTNVRCHDAAHPVVPQEETKSDEEDTTDQQATPKRAAEEEASAETKPEEPAAEPEAVQEAKSTTPATDEPKPESTPEPEQEPTLETKTTTEPAIASDQPPTTEPEVVFAAPPTPPPADPSPSPAPAEPPATSDPPQLQPHLRGGGIPSKPSSPVSPSSQAPQTDPLDAGDLSAHTTDGRLPAEDTKDPEKRHAAVLDFLRARGGLEKCDQESRENLQRFMEYFFEKKDHIYALFHYADRHIILVYDDGVYELDELEEALRWRGSGSTPVVGQWIEPDGDDDDY